MADIEDEGDVIERDAIVDQLLALGVEPGGVLLVHTSYRSVRPVEGGPLGLIDALRGALGADGTLVMPAWPGDDDEPFDPASSPTDPDLGVVPALFWQLPGVVRNEHPFACAAVGPRAGRVTSGPLPLPPHGPGSPIAHGHELDGQVLLLGVGHDANTTIHLAEVLAGVPYRVRRHCTVLEQGRAQRVEYGENDHCCQRFDFVDGWLRARNLQAEGLVGHAHARLARAQDIVAVTREELSGDPLLFLHPPEAECVECNEARSSIIA